MKQPGINDRAGSCLVSKSQIPAKIAGCAYWFSRVPQYLGEEAPLLPCSWPSTSPPAWLFSCREERPVASWLNLGVLAWRTVNELLGLKTYLSDVTAVADSQRFVVNYQWSTSLPGVRESGFPWGPARYRATGTMRGGAELLGEPSGEWFQGHPIILPFRWIEPQSEVDTLAWGILLPSCQEDLLESGRKNDPKRVKRVCSDRWARNKVRSSYPGWTSHKHKQATCWIMGSAWHLSPFEFNFACFRPLCHRLPRNSFYPSWEEPHRCCLFENRIDKACLISMLPESPFTRPSSFHPRLLAMLWDLWLLRTNNDSKTPVLSEQNTCHKQSKAVLVRLSPWFFTVKPTPTRRVSNREPPLTWPPEVAVAFAPWPPDQEGRGWMGRMVLGGLFDSFGCRKKHPVLRCTI